MLMNETGAVVRRYREETDLGEMELMYFAIAGILESFEEDPRMDFDADGEYDTDGEWRPKD